MPTPKQRRNVRIFPFMPYGICSRYATIITGKSNPYTTMRLLGDDPERTIKAAEIYKRETQNRAMNLCKKGLVKESTKKCGTPAKDRIFRCLTKEGFASLIDIPDEGVRNITEETEPNKDYDGKIKGTHYRSNSQFSTNLRDTLYDYASSDNPADQAELRAILLESVIQGLLTPFTTGIKQANTIRLTTANLSQGQLYAIWRQSHIQAMFLANDHLTCLDRKPYGPGIVIGPMHDENSYQDYIRRNGNTLPAFTYRTLTDWYSSNPGFYQITQQYPDTSDDAYNAWICTPAFYQPNELPVFQNSKQNHGREERLYGSKRTLYSISCGLAIGKKINYVCYHSKPGKFKWLVKREQETKMEMERAVHHMKTQNPKLPYNPKVDFALYFCPTHHQFLSFFARTIERHKAGLKPDIQTKEPYTSMHIIPINDTGTFLLWCLLEFSPSETTNSICKSLVAQDERFNFSTNPYFPLTYNGKRVFLGYTMDISKIHKALIEHLDGYDFYICCFPEQAVWYRKLFPGKTIL